MGCNMSDLRAALARAALDAAHDGLDIAEAILAAIEAAGAKVTFPEATREMIEAGWIDKEDVNPDDIWWAMHEAAPSLTATKEEQSKDGIADYTLEDVYRHGRDHGLRLAALELNNLEVFEGWIDKAEAQAIILALTDPEEWR